MRKVYAKAVRFTESLEHAESFVAVAVPERDLCPRYSGRYFRDLRVGRSPLWLQRALESAGISPVNNVVDTVNYILAEMGQPICAYDADKIANKQISVRLANEGESLQLPDGGQVDLEPSDLVLADAVKVIGLAGISGSQDVAITDATCNVFLECAIFDSSAVRRTTERLNMSSISSYLHECGVDRGLQTQALNNAAFMIKDLCGGEVAKGAIDISTGLQQAPPVGFSLKECNRLLGLDLKGREAADILVALGFEIVHFDHDLMMVRPPTHRIDVSCDSDLIEEIARLNGYDKLPATMPYLPARPAEVAPEAEIQHQVKDLMVSLGFSEIVGDSFISKEDMDRFSIQPERCVELENPLAQDQATLRPSLAPAIVSALKHNLQGGENDLSLFEVAPVFRKGGPDSVPAEGIHLAAGICGTRSWHWREQRGEVDFFDMKGIAERVLATLRMADCRYVAATAPFLHPGRAAAIVDGDAKIGWLGELHPGLCERDGLNARAYLLQLNLKACISQLSPRAAFENRPRFPAMERQLNVIVSLKTLSEEVVETIRATAGAYLESCAVIDHHRGAPAPTGKKSISYRLVFRAPDRILAEGDVDALQDKVGEALQTELGARLLE